MNYTDQKSTQLGAHKQQALASSKMTHTRDDPSSSSRASTDLGAEYQERAAFLEKEESPETPRLASSRTLTVRIKLQVTLLFLSLAVPIVGFLIYTRCNSQDESSDSNCLPHATEVSPCGTDPLTARNSGCYFDPLTFAWEPPRCYDFNLTADFLSKQQWEWYSDADASRPLSFESIQTGNYASIFVSWEYHRQRCAFTWMKLHRSILYGFALDGVSSDMGHVTECESVMREERDLEMTSIPLVVQYPSCVNY